MPPFPSFNVCACTSVTSAIIHFIISNYNRTIKVGLFCRQHYASWSPCAETLNWHRRMWSSSFSQRSWTLTLCAQNTTRALFNNQTELSTVYLHFYLLIWILGFFVALFVIHFHLHGCSLINGTFLLTLYAQMFNCKYDSKYWQWGVCRCIYKSTELQLSTQFGPVWSCIMMAVVTGKFL